jgi:hypothetical protein
MDAGTVSDNGSPSSSVTPTPFAITHTLTTFDKDTIADSLRELG